MHLFASAASEGLNSGPPCIAFEALLLISGGVSGDSGPQRVHGRQPMESGRSGAFQQWVVIWLVFSQFFTNLFHFHIRVSASLRSKTALSYPCTSTGSLVKCPRQSLA